MIIFKKIKNGNVENIFYMKNIFTKCHDMRCAEYFYFHKNICMM